MFIILCYPKPVTNKIGETQKLCGRKKPYSVLCSRMTKKTRKNVIIFYRTFSRFEVFLIIFRGVTRNARTNDILAARALFLQFGNVNFENVSTKITRIETTAYVATNSINRKTSVRKIVMCTFILLFTAAAVTLRVQSAQFVPYTG